MSADFNLEGDGSRSCTSHPIQNQSAVCAVCKGLFRYNDLGCLRKHGPVLRRSTPDQDSYLLSDTTVHAQRLSCSFADIFKWMWSASVSTMKRIPWCLRAQSACLMSYLIQDALSCYLAALQNVSSLKVAEELFQRIPLAFIRGNAKALLKSIPDEDSWWGRDNVECSNDPQCRNTVDEDLSDSDNDFVSVDDPAYRRRIVDVNPAKDLHAISLAYVSDHIDVDDTLDGRSVTAPDADWVGYSHASAIGNQQQTTAKN
ncbi:hypothetical protein GJ496_007487 [Pomphorhynchus laevis]|nr:hypothetical protein GJ496_007487 [Pomphorhynchus laevis]